MKYNYNKFRAFSLFPLRRSLSIEDCDEKARNSLQSSAERLQRGKGEEVLKLHNKSGFTLVEVLVAVGIFSLVISVAVGTFVGSSSSQKKIMELSDTQREASYLMETVSRELRMATAINPDQENNNDSDIEFTNYESILIEYCRADQSGGCDSNGKYFARDGKIINSSDIEITNLTFYVTDNFDGVPAGTKKQPVITVVMKVKSTGKYGTEFPLQNSIALRLYE